MDFLNWKFVERGAGIGGLIGLGALVPGLSSALKAGLIALLILSLAVLVELARRGAKPVLREVHRSVLNDTGNALVQNAHRTVVLFGGDVSWAGERKDAVATAARQSKDVTVHCVAPQNADAHENVRILQAAGASVLYSPVDHRMRGILMDPDTDSDAILWIGTRRPKRGAEKTAEGVQGTERTHDYIMGQFDVHHNETLLRTARGLHETLMVVSQRAPDPT